jgi:hypothetical protein
MSRRFSESQTILPDLQVFPIFSYVFGVGSVEAGVEAPASTRIC